MCLKLLEALLVYSVIHVFAFDDIFVNGQVSQEMVEQGRTQYQLLREKGTLPKYGSCWKSAVEHVDEGCKNLSEDTQSDIALHLTNCFLEQSGHETYNCELDKKQNLRMICISGMTDRAFNVYTEFYTHVQNICWFLRGQIWHETISDNTFKVGKQLEESAKNQEDLLEAQKASLEVQKQILKHGRLLEEVLEDLYVSTKTHQEILTILTRSIGSFQAWVIGEVSWLDSVIYYIVSGIFILVLTSLKRTENARLPLLFLLFVNLFVERLICFLLISEESVLDTKLLYEDIYSYIWFCRDLFIFIYISVIFYIYIYFRDIHIVNNEVLKTIHYQNAQILEILGREVKNECQWNSPNSDRIDLINESSFVTKKLNGYSNKSVNFDCNESTSSSYSETAKENNNYSPGRNYFPKARFPLTEVQNGRYNLRSSKQNTPEIN